MTFMLHSFHLSLPLAWAMNHTVHTVLLLCLPSATCCLCCCSSSCCCCCTFSKLFSILSFAITDTSPLPSAFFFSFTLLRWRRLSFCLAIWFYFALPVALYSSACRVALFVHFAPLLLPSSFIPSCFTLCNWIL